MSTPGATSSTETGTPSGPVCTLVMRLVSMNLAASRAWSADFTSFTNPALPRPPAYTCALTTHIPTPRCLNACAASSGVRTTSAGGTAMPKFERICRAWYSWIFMASCDYIGGAGARQRTRQAEVRPLNYPLFPLWDQGIMDVVPDESHRPKDVSGVLCKARTCGRRGAVEGVVSRGGTRALVKPVGGESDVPQRQYPSEQPGGVQHRRKQVPARYPRK